MTNRIAILLSLILTLLIGCVAKVDCLSVFKVNGSIFSPDSSIPLEGAKVIFIDKGFDTYRSKVENSMEIGEANNRGVINTKFEYFWGYDKSWFHKEPPMIFEILVIKKGFKERKLFFKAADLEQSDDYMQISLGVLQLEKE